MEEPLEVPVVQRVDPVGLKVDRVDSHPLEEPREVPVVLRVDPVGSHPLGEPLEVPVVQRVVREVSHSEGGRVVLRMPPQVGQMPVGLWRC